MKKKKSNTNENNELRPEKTGGIWRGRRIRKRWRKILALSMAAALVGNTMLWGNKEEFQVLAAPDFEESETVIYQSEWESMPELETSAIPISFFSLSNGDVPLTSYGESWFERLDLSEKGCEIISDFYNTLVEAADNDGENDFLIEEQYFNGNADESELFGKDSKGNRYIIVGKVTVDLDGNAQEVLDNTLNNYSPYIFAATQAFNRDYPDVFWLSTGGQLSCSISSSDSEGIVTFQYLLKGSEFDIRDEAYRNESAIKDAIGRRDSKVNEIISEVSNKSSVEQIRYFNEVLTKSNEYNTSSNLNTIDTDCRKCISALEGRIGEDGPVCEGYARAFKVLCDKVGISCVLVDGNSETGAHMWNNVKVGKNWYGVDVTWNDPVVKGVSGAVSGYEREDYLLVGADTDIGGETFAESHVVENRVSSTGVAFINGPKLCSTEYSGDNVPDETEKPSEEESSSQEETSSEEESSSQEETSSEEESSSQEETSSEEESSSQEETSSEEESSSIEETSSEEESSSQEETSSEEESTAPEETSSEEESTAPEETSSEEESSSQQETSSEEESTVPEETSSEEESTAPEETSSEQESSSQQETSSEEESSSIEETSSEEENSSPEETSSEQESTSQDETSPEEESTPEKETVWEEDDDDDDDSEDDSEDISSSSSNLASNQLSSDLSVKVEITTVTTKTSDGTTVQVAVTKNVSSFAPSNSVIPAPINKEEVIDYSAQKGFTSTTRGIVTGDGDGYSKWKKDEKGWWIEFANGGYAAAASSDTIQWEMINGSWYCFGNDGYAEENWIFDSKTNGWYFVDIQMGMQTGWKQIGNKWYYLNPISNGTKGKMLTNTWIGDYYINKNGEWESGLKR